MYIFSQNIFTIFTYFILGSLIDVLILNQELYLSFRKEKDTLHNKKYNLKFYVL